MAPVSDQLLTEELPTAEQPSAVGRDQVAWGSGAKILDHPERLTAAVALVSEVRLLWGRRAAKDTWRRLLLPCPEDLAARDPDGASVDVAAFAEHRVARSPGSSIRPRDLYMAYRRWCVDTGVAPTSETRFGREIVRHVRRSVGGRRRYIDCCLVNEHE